MTERVSLVCRSADAGGQLDPLRALLTLPELRGKSHLIFLIHGYNNPIDEARAAYDSFHLLQTSAVANGLDWAFGATVVEVFWPGDAVWGVARPAFYPWALPLADQTATLLGEILDDLCQFAGGHLTVDIVCHSMGNRVAMRMLSTVKQSSNLTVRRAVHMAAAVPVNRLEDVSDLLGHGLSIETSAAKAVSFYSGDDAVLAYAFPVGESTHPSEEGLFPVALGHRFWTGGLSNTSLSQVDAAPAGHGDYWPGHEVQAKVHDFLDLSVLGAHVLEGRPTQIATDTIATGVPFRMTNSRKTGVELFNG